MLTYQSFQAYCAELDAPAFDYPRDLRQYEVPSDYTLSERLAIEKTIAYEEYLTQFIINPHYCDYLFQGYLLHEEETAIHAENLTINSLIEQYENQCRILAGYEVATPSFWSEVSLYLNAEYQTAKRSCERLNARISWLEQQLSERTVYLNKIKRERYQNEDVIKFSDLQNISAEQLRVESDNIKFNRSPISSLDGATIRWYQELRTKNHDRYQHLEKEVTDLREHIAFSAWSSASLLEYFNYLNKVELSMSEVQKEKHNYKYFLEFKAFDKTLSYGNFNSQLIAYLKKVRNKKIVIAQEMLKRLEEISIQKDISEGHYLLRFDQSLVERGCHERIEAEVLLPRSDLNRFMIDGFTAAIASVQTQTLEESDKKMMAGIKKKMEELNLAKRPAHLYDIKQETVLEQKLFQSNLLWFAINELEAILSEGDEKKFTKIFDLLTLAKSTYDSIVRENKKLLAITSEPVQLYIQQKLQAFSETNQNLTEEIQAKIFLERNRKIKALICDPLCTPGSVGAENVDSLKEFSGYLDESEDLLKTLKRETVNLKSDILFQALGAIKTDLLTSEKVEFIKQIIICLEKNEKSKETKVYCLNNLNKLATGQYHKITNEDLAELGKMLDEELVGITPQIIKKIMAEINEGNYTGLSVLEKFYPPLLIENKLKSFPLSFYEALCQSLWEQLQQGLVTDEIIVISQLALVRKAASIGIGLQAYASLKKNLVSKLEEISLKDVHPEMKWVSNIFISTLFSEEEINTHLDYFQKRIDEIVNVKSVFHQSDYFLFNKLTPHNKNEVHQKLMKIIGARFNKKQVVDMAALFNLLLSIGNAEVTDLFCEKLISEVIEKQGIDLHEKEIIEQYYSKITGEAKQKFANKVGLMIYQKLDGLRLQKLSASKDLSYLAALVSDETLKKNISAYELTCEYIHKLENHEEINFQREEKIFDLLGEENTIILVETLETNISAEHEKLWPLSMLSFSKNLLQDERCKKIFVDGNEMLVHINRKIKARELLDSAVYGIKNLDESTFKAARNSLRTDYANRNLKSNPLKSTAQMRDSDKEIVAYIIHNLIETARQNVITQPYLANYLLSLVKIYQRDLSDEQSLEVLHMERKLFCQDEYLFQLSQINRRYIPHSLISYFPDVETSNFMGLGKKIRYSYLGTDTFQRINNAYQALVTKLENMGEIPEGEIAIVENFIQKQISKLETDEKNLSSGFINKYFRQETIRFLKEYRITLNNAQDKVTSFKLHAQKLQGYYEKEARNIGEKTDKLTQQEIFLLCKEHASSLWLTTQKGSAKDQRPRNYFKQFERAMQFHPRSLDENTVILYFQELSFQFTEYLDKGEYEKLPEILKELSELKIKYQNKSEIISSLDAILSEAGKLLYSHAYHLVLSFAGKRDVENPLSRLRVSAFQVHNNFKDTYLEILPDHADISHLFENVLLYKECDNVFFSTSQEKLNKPENTSSSLDILDKPFLLSRLDVYEKQGTKRALHIALLSQRFARIYLDLFLAKNNVIKLQETFSALCCHNSLLAKSCRQKIISLFFEKTQDTSGFQDILPPEIKSALAEIVQQIKTPQSLENTQTPRSPYVANVSHEEDLKITAKAASSNTVSSLSVRSLIASKEIKSPLVPPPLSESQQSPKLFSA